MKNYLLLFICFIFTSCTTIGVMDRETLDNTDFGQVEDFRICILKDISVSDEQAMEIFASLQEEFSIYGLQIDVPWVKNWKRPGFFLEDIILDVQGYPLQEPCDRLLALVGRGFSDFMWGIILPEVLGAVENYTMTKGYAVAEMGSFNQVVTFSNPESIAIHETYHLLGCGHSLTKNACIHQIKLIKNAARENREAGHDFFPSSNLKGTIFRTRAEVDNELGVDYGKFASKAEPSTINKEIIKGNPGKR